MVGLLALTTHVRANGGFAGCTIVYWHPTRNMAVEVVVTYLILTVVALYTLLIKLQNHGVKPSG